MPSAWSARPWSRFALVALTAACFACDAPPPSRVVLDTDFETGSVGSIERVGAHAWDLHLRDDNDDSMLPDSYRSWWHVRLRDVTPGERITFTIHNRGWRVYYVPVYSYDGKTWHRFDEREVRNGRGCTGSIASCTLEITTTRFNEPTVYIARFYPYTTADLEAYLAEIALDPHVEILSLGASSAFGYDIPLVRIAYPSSEISERRAIWIHARTHPSETAASFMVEGLIDRLLDDLAEGDPEARQLVYLVVPMHNVDGVLAGNARTDTESRNLEIEWHIDADDPQRLDPSAPLENRLLNAAMIELMDPDAYAGDAIALNLHASNAEPEAAPFAFPHFGSDPELYAEPEAMLWERQAEVLERVGHHYPGPFALPTDGDGGADFLDFPFPETWWWWNRGPDAVALTIEAVYGKPAGEWLTPSDLRELGESLTLAIYDYHFGAAADLALPATLRETEAERPSVPDEIETRL